MKSIIEIENIKCNGCATTIKSKVESVEGASDAIVDVDSGQVSFEFTKESVKEEVIKVLRKWGYPLVGKGSKLDAAKSYVGCMIGKVDNLASK